MTRIDAATAHRLQGTAERPQPKAPAGDPRRQSEGERALEHQLRMVGTPRATAEYRFDPSRLWRLDFAWPELKVGIEVEGGSWTGGRHVRGQGFEADCDKYNEAAIRGWLVLRVTTAMVADGRAVTLVGRALWMRGQER